ncbi:MAG: uracil phosphoribosyltransferase [Cellulophaga sp.]|nr:uracil phosphoribosyltransferase [Cellulophaga sp.]
MESLFRAIEDLFVNILFAPFDMLRTMDSWWGANTLNWVFMTIGSVAFVYWMLQLKKYNNETEKASRVSAHSYIGNDANNG